MESSDDDVVAFIYDLLASYAEAGKTITYGRLYDRVATQFDWRKRSTGNWWARKLPLAELATLNGKNGEPALACLVRKDKPGRPVGVGYKTAHRNCHGVDLIGHSSECACETCEAISNSAARAEARKCRDHFRRA